MKKAAAIKAYFAKPGVRDDMHYPLVSLAELKECIEDDSQGYSEMAELCAAELGETIDKDTRSGK